LIDTDPFKYAADLKLKIERHPELSPAEVAERMRVSAQRISDWLALNAVIPEIRELYRTGEIDLAACERAGRLPSCNSRSRFGLARRRVRSWRNSLN
jgi:hypothetical protein